MSKNSDTIVPTFVACVVVVCLIWTLITGHVYHWIPGIAAIVVALGIAKVVR